MKHEETPKYTKLMFFFKYRWLGFPPSYVGSLTSLWAPEHYGSQL